MAGSQSAITASISRELNASIQRRSKSTSRSDMDTHLGEVQFCDMAR
jgi:hypothetical protein